MPSSLERVISLPLVYSTHVPVSVYGTGIILSKSMSFSWKKWRKKKYVIPPAKVAFFFNFICSSLSTNKITVQEYKPTFHRLRLSASPQVLTDPLRTSLAEEPLRFRGTRFSLVFSLLNLTFSLPPGPPRLTRLASPWAERSSTTYYVDNISIASAKNLVPEIFGAKTLDQ